MMMLYDGANESTFWGKQKLKYLRYL